MGISDLEQAYTIAQEWMNNAVIQNQNLVQQVDVLTNENNISKQQQQQEQQTLSSKQQEQQQQSDIIQEKYNNIYNLYQQIKDEKDDITTEYKQKIINLEKDLNENIQNNNIVQKKYDDTLVLLQQIKIDNEKKILLSDYEKLQLDYNTCRNDMESIQLELNNKKELETTTTKMNNEADVVDNDDQGITSFLEIDEEKEELRKELYEVKHKLHNIEKEYETSKVQHQNEIYDIQIQLNEQQQQQQQQLFHNEEE